MELKELAAKRDRAKKKLEDLLTCEQCYHQGDDVTEQDYHDRGRDSTAYLCVDGDACEARKN